MIVVARCPRTRLLHASPVGQPVGHVALIDDGTTSPNRLHYDITNDTHYKRHLVDAAFLEKWLPGRGGGVAAGGEVRARSRPTRLATQGSHAAAAKPGLRNSIIPASLHPCIPGDRLARLRRRLTRGVHHPQGHHRPSAVALPVRWSRPVVALVRGLSAASAAGAPGRGLRAAVSPQSLLAALPSSPEGPCGLCGLLRGSEGCWRGAGVGSGRRR